jgi:hypothetical protein
MDRYFPATLSGEVMAISWLRDRVNLVWIFLILATLVSWSLGTGHELDARYGGVIIIAVAMIKVRLVGRYFMELRDAPIPLMTLFECWVVAVGLMLIGLFLFA